jgi:hypothetical protein
VRFRLPPLCYGKPKQKNFLFLLKSDLSARGARAEALCAEATNAEHTIWLPIKNVFRTLDWDFIKQEVDTTQIELLFSSSKHSIYQKNSEYRSYNNK